MTHDWIALLRTHTARFTKLLADADPDTPVEHCPGWTVRDLAVHLGGVHQWVVHAILAGDPSLTPEPPEATEDLAEWYDRQATALVDLLEGTPPDAPAWTLDRDDPTAGFWRRRQVHEVVVHVRDLEHALGATTPIDPVLAWDGVREVVDVLLPRQVRLGRTPEPTTAVRLVPTDVTGPGAAVLGQDDAVELRAPAERLLLLLWHRADVAGLDPRAADVLAHALTP